MSIKFETINGQLCRMVEPTPLTEKSQFPCVVRLIQDDSPMGRLNRRYRDTNIKQDIKYICVSVKNSVMQTETDSIMAIEAYEIIGYPVEEGSHWWALYQMQCGKKVVSSNGTVYWQDKDDNDLIKYTDGYGQKWVQTPYLFLRCVDASGWQIYKEPEPEPEFKVGDWVEVDGQKQGKIDHFCSDDFLQDNSNLFVLHDYMGRWYGYQKVTNITRKLKPSEVRVKITLEGQVTKPMDNTGGRFWLYYSFDEYVSIELDALSHKDRELVESLLKAQEEK